MFTAFPYGFEVSVPPEPALYFAHRSDALFFCRELYPGRRPRALMNLGRAVEASKLDWISTLHLRPVAVPAGIALSHQLFWLGEYLRQEGHLRQALIAMRKAMMVNLEPSVPSDFLFYVGKLECAVGDKEAGLHALQKGVEMVPDNPNFIYSLGSLLMSSGRVREADALFARGVDIATGDGNSTNTRALCFDDAGPDVEGAKILFQQEATCNATAVYFSAADSRYFKRYARAVAKSVARFTGGRAALHFHIVSPDEEALTLAGVLAGDGSVTISIEYPDLAGLTETQRRTYYACSRYRVLPLLMNRMPVPIVVTDMDQIVIGSPGPLLDFALQRDVSLVRFSAELTNAFSLFSATLAVVMPTAGGRRFAERLAMYVTQGTSDPSRMCWHLDQAAIARAHFQLPDVDFGYIPLWMLHLDPGAPDSGENAPLFWSITNSIAANLSKLESDAFRQFC